MKDKIKYYYWYFKTSSSRKSLKKLKIMSIIETIDAIIAHQKSISRFGDGELRMMMGNGKIVFQKENIELSNRLEEVLTSNLKNHIIALPETFYSVKKIKLASKYFWIEYLNKNSATFSKYLSINYSYGNAFISILAYLFFKIKLCVNGNITSCMVVQLLCLCV